MIYNAQLRWKPIAVLLVLALILVSLGMFLVNHRPAVESVGQTEP
jgi:lipopolysaccharide export LptBFGC system permease protein LptF